MTSPGQLVICAGMVIGLSGPTHSTRSDHAAHWAFAPPVRYPAPSSEDAEWIRNPIDAFVLAGSREFDLRPVTEADRHTLLRRVTLDLTGLPPSRKEVEDFVEDVEPGAFERVVDRLLASPAYGERWGQHWLDLARYADTDGFEFDQARPEMWRYRDWVIRALNEDIPFDRFVALQMAGDELEPGNPDAILATGFHRCHPDMVDLNDQGERRQIALDDITETTGSVFLGLTLGCARCHDHKFDPLTQVDFYRLQDVFTPAEFVNECTVVGDGGESQTLRARVLLERTRVAPPTHVRIRGDYHRRGEEVHAGIPAVLAKDGRSDLTAVESGQSTGRRSALAAWLTRPDQPLTPRVLVNRLWQHHFGRGLVATPSDFGTMGAPPTHPELLDWLATELIRRDWSLKAMHRLMVTSSAYRRSSMVDARGQEIDPGNELIWRQNRQRLEAETIRDMILHASGLMSVGRRGPGVFPELPPELSKLSGKGEAWPVSMTAEERDRPSIYIFVRRNLRYPLFEVFDRPDTNASCPRRVNTTIAPQALSLLNDPLCHRAARALAFRAAKEATEGLEARVALMYLLTLGRPPDHVELGASIQLVREEGAELDGLTSLAIVLFNLNEFIYSD